MSLSDGDTKETVGRARKSEVIRSNNATVSGAGEHGPTCDRCGDHLTVERKHLHSESKSLSGTAPVVSGGEGQSFPMRGTKHHLPRRNEGFSRLHGPCFTTQHRTSSPAYNLLSPVRRFRTSCCPHSMAWVDDRYTQCPPPSAHAHAHGQASRVLSREA